MLNIINRNKLVFNFFVFTLIIVVYLTFVKKDILDLFYMFVVIYYFIKFLNKKN